MFHDELPSAGRLLLEGKMTRKTWDRGLDVFVWVVLIGLLVMGARIGFSDMVAQGMPKRGEQILPAGVERADGRS